MTTNGNGKKYTIGAIVIASMATLIVSLILSFLTITSSVAKREDVAQLETRVRMLETSHAALTEKLDNVRSSLDQLRQTVDFLNNRLYPTGR